MSDLTKFFRDLEERVLWRDDIIFDIEKIKAFSMDYALKEIQGRTMQERGFFFEELSRDFFRYLGFMVESTKRTRDLGIDGIVRMKLEPLGQLELGLQAKWKKIGSEDLDSFLQALQFAEIKLGVLTCKDSRDMQKYTMSSKIKALLLKYGRDKEIENVPDLDMKPVFILKFEDLIDIFSKRVRSVVSAVYKR